MIAIIGGGTIVAAGVAGGGFLATRTPDKALAPWAAAGGYTDPRKRALSYALLAPNPHNLQPWLVKLEGENAFSLHHDTSRRIPHTDPMDRQITIGFGCFLEQMRIAATLDGLTADIALYPDGSNNAIARVVLKPGATGDPLAGAIMYRRSCKQPFEDTLVKPAQADALSEYAQIITDKAKVSELRDLTWAAWKVEWDTTRTRMESVDLMRFGKGEINANPDGIALGGPFLEGLMLAGLLTREAQADLESTSNKEGMKTYRKMLYATPAYAVLTSKGNRREDQIEAGYRWLRLNLATTQAGLALHPVSQALQEYPEVADHFAQVHAMPAAPGETVQMLGRLGYGPQTALTPRWPLEAKLRSG
ncbi:MAG: twin-arginine translocation pathway signal protein [Rhodobacteraceae bacterium]|nr:twin-arginine translocation pathway signal protein [Paracoccaceae bacterium]